MEDLTIKVIIIITEGEKILKQASLGKELTQQESTTARDMLITHLGIDSGTRPGPLYNATLQDYESAECEDGIKVMLVVKHKRAKDGPAIVPIQPDLQEHMETYVRKIRPKFAGKKEEKPFVTNEGKGFREGTIGRRLSQVCPRAGVHLGDRLAHVDMRKLVSTKAKENATPEEAALVRRVMAHSKVTADRSYVRSNLSKLGAKAAKVIARVTSTEADPQKIPTTEEKVEADSAQGGDNTSHEQEDDATSTHEEDIPVLESSSEKTPGNSATGPSEAAGPSGLSMQSSCSVFLISSKPVPPTPAKPLTDKQKETIQKVFESEIKKGQKVVMEQVQSKCRTTAILSSLAFSKNRVKQVVNHINYLISKESTAVPHDLAEPSTSKVHSWLDDFDNPSTRSSGRRENWSDADSQILERNLKRYDTLPSTVVIRTLFNNDTDLYDILKREGWNRTYNKIKNIFRKRTS